MSLDFDWRRLVLAAIAGVTLLPGITVRPPSQPPRFDETSAATPLPSRGTLRVCADPNNQPFSNASGEGFENKIAELAARTLGRQLQYYWHPQRRGFIRSTLAAGACDVVMGMLATSSSEMVRTTTPYYRSSYVFISRRDRHLAVHSLDDPRLKQWRIGIQLSGNDYGNPPPAQALASRHILQNVRGYPVYGDYSSAAPQRGIIAAVADGAVDVAIAWGPVAGYFAAASEAPVDVAAVSPLQDGAHLPLAFSISMAVRRGDEPLAAALNTLVTERKADLRHILDEFHVPLVGRPSGTS
jgi:mxaJ protein